MKERQYSIIILLLIISSIVMSQEVPQTLIFNSEPPLPDFVRTDLKTTNSDWHEVGVPCYLWSYGCNSTTVAMLSGYYDRHGYWCMYNGSVNGGAAPLFNDPWPDAHQYITPTSYYPNWDNPLSASKNGLDGRSIDGHVEDFWVFPYTAVPNDPNGWVGNTPPHDFYSNGNPCAADYLGTSQDKFNNSDGATYSRYYAGGQEYRYQNDANYTPNTMRDITEGLTLLFEDGTANAYTVNDCYTQLIDLYPGVNPGYGFTFENLQDEIDAGRPVLANFRSTSGVGHSGIIFGYNDVTDEIVIWDTWNESRTELPWGGTISSHNSTVYDFMGVTVLVLAGQIKSTYEPMVCYEGTIGPHDNVIIKDPPLNTKFPPLTGSNMLPNTLSFGAGGNVHFYAEFNSYYCDTWTHTFNWKIELYHTEGVYELLSTTTQGYDNYPTICKSSSYLTATIPSSIPDYNWLRNDDGSISGKISVETEDNNGYINESDEVFVKFNYFPNKPTLTILDSDNDIVTLSISSKGAESYLVNYGQTTINSTIEIHGNQALEGTSAFSIGDNTIFALSGIPKGTSIGVNGTNGFGSSGYSNIVNYATYADLPYHQSFENSVDDSWIFSHSNSNGCIDFEIDELATPKDGYYTLVMNACTNGTYVANYADLHINLQQANYPYLKFWWQHMNDEYHAEFDGVWFSDNGGSTFKKVFDLNGSQYSSQIWQYFSLNITTLAGNAGLELTKNFVIRFAQYDNYHFQSDGFIIDDVDVVEEGQQITIHTNSLTASKDAFLYMNTKPGYEYAINTNYGDYPMIRTDEWTHSGYRTNTKSLLEFNLLNLPKTTKIKSAFLSLYSNDPQPSPSYKQMTYISTGNSGYKSNASWLKRVVQEWDEHTVTYNNCPLATDVKAKYIPISSTYTQDYINIDVSDMIQDIVNLGADNHGFLLTLDNEERYTCMSFASSDHTNSSLHPTLSLEYWFDENLYTVPFTTTYYTGNSSDDWDVGGAYPDGADVAFLVYVPTTITVDATTCFTETNFDTQLEIFKASGETTGYYNNDNSYCGIIDLYATIEGAILTPGYYYFVVDGDGGDVGNLKLSVSETNPFKSTNDGIQINNSESLGEVRVYPNPVNDFINIEGLTDKSKISVYQTSGQLVYSINSSRDAEILDVSSFKEGYYIVEILMGEKIGRYNIIISK